MQQEIFLIIIGAAIGFVSSIGTIIVTNLMNSHGKVKIYYKIVCSKVNSGHTWGFYKGVNGLSFEVPIWFEVQNTSNTVKVIRDLNILLFNDGKEICQMIQANKTEIKKDDSVKEVLFGNEGAYSFMLQPRSIEKYDCHFLIKQNDIGEKSQFNEIWLRYFDEKDKSHKYLLKKVDHCWELGNLEKEGIWQLAKK